MWLLCPVPSAVVAKGRLVALRLLCWMAELALSFLCHRVDAKKGSASAQNTTPLSLVKSFTTPGTSSEEHPYNSTNTQSLKMELIQLNNYVLLQSLSWRGGPML